jgi:hypothetical protein
MENIILGSVIGYVLLSMIIGGYLYYKEFKKRIRIKIDNLKDGDVIKITYLSPCINGQGSPNPYIGMQGVVYDFNGKEFSIQTVSSWLVNIDIRTCEYEKLG